MESGRKQLDTRGIRKFSQDSCYFLKYYAWSAVLFSIIDVSLLMLWDKNPLHVALSPIYLVFIPFGLYLGGLSAVYIHNAAHGSFRPRWLNRVAGELAGTHQLYGFVGWRTAHIIHHHYPDDQERDPHPPLNLSFWEFSYGMRSQLQKVLTNSYFDIWGRSESQRIWKIKNLCGYFGMAVRLVFWFLLLGPSVFVLLYVPSYIFNYFFFSHFNYYTHRLDPNSREGQFEVLNLSDGYYYRLTNLIFFGIYHHRTHHSKPYLFNPQKLVSSPNRVSNGIVTGQRDLPPVIRHAAE